MAYIYLLIDQPSLSLGGLYLFIDRSTISIDFEAGSYIRKLPYADYCPRVPHPTREIT
jgi:hypothetical protein